MLSLTVNEVSNVQPKAGGAEKHYDPVEEIGERIHATDCVFNVAIAVTARRRRGVQIPHFINKREIIKERRSSSSDLF